LPWQGLAGMNISDTESGNAASAVGVQSSATAGVSAMPRPENRAPTSASGRVPSGVAGSQSGYVPPHIRALNGESSVSTSRPKPTAEKLIDIGGDAKTVSSASNPYEDAWSSTGTLGPWSAVDTRRRNAFYAPQRSIDERTPSHPVTASAPSQVKGRNGWARTVSTPTYTVDCRDKSETNTLIRREYSHHNINSPSRRPRVIVGPTTVMAAPTRCRTQPSLQDLMSLPSWDNHKSAMGNSIGDSIGRLQRSSLVSLFFCY
jgi:hypothetical protein